ncbi:hypothetical protein LTR66_012535 [Elasticomyces elasticus]|nr:hypothetical protein LTR66_012535 [Elasticomyces elasticus]KAK5009076.1 hypothetical protein LTR28_002852 [Elasticomyces elasticus]
MPSYEGQAVAITLTTSPDNEQRRIDIQPNVPVIVGRASNFKSESRKTASNNAFFDCKVISSNHAVLNASVVKNGQVTITDTQSSHGTKVNGRRLSSGSPYPLKPGDTVEFGQEVTREGETYYALEVTFDVTHNPYVPRQSTKVGPPKVLAQTKDHAGTYKVPDDSEYTSDDSDYDYNDDDTQRSGNSASASPSPAPSSVTPAEKHVPGSSPCNPVTVVDSTEKTQIFVDLVSDDNVKDLAVNFVNDSFEDLDPVGETQPVAVEKAPREASPSYVPSPQVSYRRRPKLHAKSSIPIEDTAFGALSGSHLSDSFTDEEDGSVSSVGAQYDASDTDLIHHEYEADNTKISPLSYSRAGADYWVIDQNSMATRSLQASVSGGPAAHKHLTERVNRDISQSRMTLGARSPPPVSGARFPFDPIRPDGTYPGPSSFHTAPLPPARGPYHGETETYSQDTYPSSYPTQSLYHPPSAQCGPAYTTYAPPRVQTCTFDGVTYAPDFRLTTGYQFAPSLYPLMPPSTGNACSTTSVPLATAPSLAQNATSDVAPPAQVDPTLPTTSKASIPYIVETDVPTETNAIIPGTDAASLKRKADEMLAPEDAPALESAEATVGILSGKTDKHTEHQKSRKAGTSRPKQQQHKSNRNPVEPPAKRVKLQLAASALTGAVIGGLGVLTALVALPERYFQ